MLSARLFAAIWNYKNILVSYQFATDVPKCVVLRYPRFRYVSCWVKLVVQFVFFCKAKRTCLKCQQEK